MERLAREKLPRGYDFEWTELYFQEMLAGNTAVFIFPLCVLFVFLTLAAQYESWSLPLAIILIVPMCLLAAIAGVWLRGMDNNIFTQIGFVVLVGLACKNAILIVEFAKQREDAGQDAHRRRDRSRRLRLRPILMTSFAFILGVVPLVIAERRRRGDAPGARHGRVLRHARRDALRPVPDAGVLRVGEMDRGALPTRGPVHDIGRSHPGHQRPTARTRCDVILQFTQGSHR